MKVNLSAIQTKLVPVVFGVILTLISFVAVSYLIKGARIYFLLVVSLVLGVTLVLALDKYYWFIVPVAFAVNGLPFLPMRFMDLAFLVLIPVYFFRLAQRKEKSIKITPLIFFATLPFCWILLVWFLNPTGFNIFGSTLIGGRFYFSIVLAFISFLILTTIEINEKTAKILFWALFIGTIFSLLKDIATANVLNPNQGDSSIEFSGRYEFVAAANLFVLCLSRYDLRVIFSKIKILIFMVLCTIMVVFSGKRQCLFLIGIAPIFKAFVYKKNQVLTFISYLVVVFILVFAVAGDDVFYDLPVSARRGLSIVVPKYRQNNIEGVQDEFRYLVRLKAKEVIKENKLFGRGGFAVNANELRWLYFTPGRNIDAVISTGAWHNTWLAFACDFGIFCAVLWGMYMVILVPFLYKSARRTRNMTYTTSCIFFFMMLLYMRIILSNATGHVEMTTRVFWVSTGMVCALVNGLKNKKVV